ncbi:MAG: hypothetical protein QNK82_03685 [Akkermansiaceae bacterium]|jgi:hypothetical protein
MKHLVFVLLLTLGLPLFAKEHVILCGGPASRKWENLRVENYRHDRWWANFIRASTMRMDEILRSYGPSAKITWIVYKNGYLIRSRDDSKPYTTWIAEQAAKRNVKLVWINTGPKAISAINAHSDIITFDFFGHSNRHCFMLDYGSEVMAVSQCWIHERDLGKIRRRSFSKNALCQSWGCYTSQSMSAVWKRNLGITLIGAEGKTDYSALSFGKMPTVPGRWVR